MMSRVSAMRPLPGDSALSSIILHHHSHEACEASPGGLRIVRGLIQQLSVSASGCLQGHRPPCSGIDEPGRTF